MSRLSKLGAKSNEIDLGGEKITIHALTNKNLGLMLRAGNEETREKALLELINLTLRKAIPDVTDEEIENMGIEHTLVLINAINEVNGMDVKSGKSPVVKKELERLANIRAAGR